MGGGKLEEGTPRGGGCTVQVKESAGLNQSSGPWDGSELQTLEAQPKVLEPAINFSEKQTVG